MRRARSGFVVFLGVLAVVGVLASVLALWADQVLFDSDTFADAIDETLEEPEVIDGLAARLTDELFTAVDVEALVTDAVGDTLDPFAPVLAGGARTIVDQALTTALGSEQVRSFVVDAARTAHGTALRILEDGDLLRGDLVDDGQVTINLLPVLVRGLATLQDAGLLGDVELPELTRDQDADEQLQLLQDAVDRPLPDDFGQLVVYDSATLADAQTSLAQAQRAVSLFRQAVTVIVVVTLVSLVASIALAHDRRRVASTVLLAGAAALAVGLASVRVVIDRAPDLATQPAAREAIRTTVDSLASGLVFLLTAGVLAFLVITVVASLTGAGEAERTRRTRLEGSLGRLRDHADTAALAAFVLAVLLVAVAGLGLVTAVVALALVGLGSWLRWQGPTPSTPDPASSREAGARTGPTP